MSRILMISGCVLFLALSDAAALTIKTEFGSTQTCSYKIQGIFIVWWDKKWNYEAEATNVLKILNQTRTWCLDTFKMGDPPNVGRGFYVNIYIHNGQDLFPDGWGQGVGTDSYGNPFYTAPLGNTNGGSTYHEGFHLFQYNSSSPGFAYAGDSQWYIESSANWFADITASSLKPDDFVCTSAITANPQDPLWISFNNKAPGIPDNWQRDCHQYGMDILLYYLTEKCSVAREIIANGFYAKTSLKPQAYLCDRIGLDKMRGLYADWAIHTAGGCDYLPAGTVARAATELKNYGDPKDVHPIVKSYTTNGTNGVWERVPALNAPAGWAYNLFEINNSSSAAYTIELSGDAAGSSGAPSWFALRAAVKNSSGPNTYHALDPADGRNGTMTVNMTAAQTKAWVVVASTPNHFTGNQTYSYRIKITKGAVVAVRDVAHLQPAPAPEASTLYTLNGRAVAKVSAGIRRSSSPGMLLLRACGRFSIYMQPASITIKW